MIFAVLDLSPLTVCINCSFFTFIGIGSSNWVEGLSTWPATYDNCSKSKGRRLSRSQSHVTYQQQQCYNSAMKSYQLQIWWKLSSWVAHHLARFSAMYNQCSRSRGQRSRSLFWISALYFLQCFNADGWETKKSKKSVPIMPQTFSSEGRKLSRTVKRQKVK